MHPFYNAFISLLDQADKEHSVQFILSKLQNNSIDVVTLYNEILTPALYAQFCKPEQKAICIWEEHVRTSIVRTIIECCFPYMLKEREEKYHATSKGKTLVLCPSGELHEVGARMVSDFFTLCGFDTEFIGANTPQDDIINAISYLKPKYVGISITNYFNLVEAKRVVQKILDLKTSISFKLILGGQACQSNQETCRQMNPDMILNTFQDIRRLSDGEG